MAWLEDHPAGDVYLSLEPDPNQAVRRLLPGVPTLVHLEVLGPYQRRGIGSALIHAGEDTVRRLGHSGHPVTVSETIHMLVRTL